MRTGTEERPGKKRSNPSTSGCSRQANSKVVICLIVEVPLDCYSWTTYSDRLMSNSTVALQHFITGKVAIKGARKEVHDLYISHKAMNATQSYFLSNTSESKQLLAEEPVYMCFGDSQIACVNPKTKYSRDMLISKFESTMSRKTRREYFKPLKDEDMNDAKYVSTG